MIRCRSCIGLMMMTAAGCAGSHAEQTRDARIGGIEARADAKQERTEDRADVREEAIDRRYEARTQQVEASDRPGEDAQEKLVELSKERTDFRANMQTRMENLAIRINAAQQKLDVLSERAPTSLRTELQTIVTQYNMLKTDVEGLHGTPDVSWGAKRSDIEQRTEMLDDRVVKLNDAIGRG